MINTTIKSEPKVMCKTSIKEQKTNMVITISINKQSLKGSNRDTVILTVLRNICDSITKMST